MHSLHSLHCTALHCTALQLDFVSAAGDKETAMSWLREWPGSRLGVTAGVTGFGEDFKWIHKVRELIGENPSQSDRTVLNK